MRRCFECGQRTDAAQLTAVGDGEFCPACFRQLLAVAGDAPEPPSAPLRVAPPRDAPTRAPAPAAPQRPSAPSCLVCERAIDGAAAVSFLGGEICAACNAQMLRELREGEERDAAEQAASRRAAAADAASLEREVVVTFTPGAETRWCAGCERPMPGPGSYRMLGGEPYCPACVPFYAALNLGAQPRHPAAAAGPPTASAPACDCCGAALEPNTEPDEGFRFCRACTTSDRELALGVARARHRRKLEALRAAIDTGKKS